jgi:hypothetical protein
MRSAGVIGRSPRHGRPPLGFVTAGGFVTLDGGFVTGFSAGGVMVRVPLMTPIGHGGGSACSLSSCSQAAQCNIHQAFIIALLALLCFHGAALRRHLDISDEQAESGRVHAPRVRLRYSPNVIFYPSFQWVVTLRGQFHADNRSGGASR